VGVDGEVAEGGEVLVRVTWRDAYAETDEGDYEGDDYLVQTVGYLLPASDNFVRIAQEKTPDPAYRGVTCIPPSLIVNREVLSAQSLQVVRSETV
jgi:hypothetical protein